MAYSETRGLALHNAMTMAFGPPRLSTAHATLTSFSATMLKWEWSRNGGDFHALQNGQKTTKLFRQKAKRGGKNQKRALKSHIRDTVPYMGHSTVGQYTR